MVNDSAVKRTGSVVATLLPDASAHRLRTALRDRQELVPCENWEAIFSLCERLPVRIVVFDLFTGGAANFARTRFLKRKYPRLILVAYISFKASRVQDVFDAGRQGIDGLVIEGADDAPRSLLAQIERAESRSLAGSMRRALEGMPAVAVDATLLAVTRAHEALTPDQFAQAFGLARRTMASRLSAVGFPSPQRLLTWGRLLLAAHLLEDSSRSADRVAKAVQFPSATAFRNTCQRHLGATPSEIRSRGGARFVKSLFLREIGQGKAALSSHLDQADLEEIESEEAELNTLPIEAA
jgi:AraC-like DNA-binding protein